MKCPACSNILTETQAGEVKVDLCRGGCGGVWFDEFEIKKFDEVKEFDGELIVKVERDPSIKIDYNAVRYCPRCPDEAMCKRFYDINRQVEVDQCLHCSGIWLDVGELGIIREQYETQADRQQAADEYVSSELQRVEVELQEDTRNELAQWSEDTSLGGVLRAIFGKIL